jgi:hypothetical protein
MRKTTVAIAFVLAWALAATTAARGATANIKAKAKVDPLAPYIRGIEEAATAADATRNYGAALEQDRKNIPLRETYLRRMVALGMVDMLAYQANMLVNLDPNNGLAWAVLAFQEADRGAMTDAFDSLVRAVANRPEEPFVIDLAGQLVAWYDLQRDKSSLPGKVREAVDRLRRQLGGELAFAQGYKAANAALTKAPVPKGKTQGDRRTIQAEPEPQPYPEPYTYADPGYTYYPVYHPSVILYPHHGRHGSRRFHHGRVGIIFKPDGSKVVLTPKHPIGGVEIPPHKRPGHGVKKPALRGRGHARATRVPNFGRSGRSPTPRAQGRAGRVWASPFADRPVAAAGRAGRPTIGGSARRSAGRRTVSRGSGFTRALSFSRAPARRSSGSRSAVRSFRSPSRRGSSSRSFRGSSRRGGFRSGGFRSGGFRSGGFRGGGSRGGGRR